MSAMEDVDTVTPAGDDQQEFSDDDIDETSDVEEVLDDPDSNMMERLTRDATRTNRISQLRVGNMLDFPIDHETGETMVDTSMDPSTEWWLQFYDVLEEKYLDADTRELLELLIENIPIVDDNPLRRVDVAAFRRIVHEGTSTSSATGVVTLESLLIVARRYKADDIEEIEAGERVDAEHLDQEYQEDRGGRLDWAEDMVHRLQQDYHDNMKQSDNECTIRSLDSYLESYSAGDVAAVRAYLVAQNSSPDLSLSGWIDEEKHRHNDESEPILAPEHRYAADLLLDLVIECLDDRCEAHDEANERYHEITSGLEKLLGTLDHIDSLRRLQPERGSVERDEVYRVAERVYTSLKDGNVEELSYEKAIDLRSQMQQFYLKAHTLLDEEGDFSIHIGTLADFYDQMRTSATGHEQISHGTILPAPSFERLVREIGAKFKHDLEFSNEALAALQAASEGYLIQQFDLTGAQLATTTRTTADTPDGMTDHVMAPVQQLLQPRINLSHVFRTSHHEFDPVPQMLGARSLATSRPIAMDPTAQAIAIEQAFKSHPNIFKSKDETNEDEGENEEKKG